MWGMINEANNYKQEFKDDKLQLRTLVRVMSACRVYAWWLLIGLMQTRSADQVEFDDHKRSSKNQCKVFPKFFPVILFLLCHNV